MKRAAAEAQTLLATSSRVLVVYGEDGARLYCEPGDASKEPSAAPAGVDGEQEEPPSASSRRKR
ncbi:MAG: hypothetical protein L0Y64_08300 [Myxococcaceae bacterium]|nr:hypothetical protein [Myxococcaceae bacterium]